VNNENGVASKYRLLRVELIIMNDKFSLILPAAPIGYQIRELRLAKGYTLAALAQRAGTSAPTVHRYESGWDRFEVGTLRRIGAALGAHLEIRLVPNRTLATARQRSATELLPLIAPLFWDHDLAASDFRDHPSWVLERVLMFGNRRQVAAARTFFGDQAIRETVTRRGVDERTRNFWNVILEAPANAPESSQHERLAGRT